MNDSIPDDFPVGTPVQKVGGDYTFDGIVVASFLKLNQKARRYVVEDDRGILHVYSAKVLKLHERFNSR